MSEQQALNATFFTLKARSRMVLLPASLVMLAILAVIVALFLWAGWGTFASFVSMFQGGEPSEEQVLRMVGGMFGMFGVMFLLLIPLYIALAAYEAGCLRWMIRGEAPGLFGMTFDADTWRVYGVYWCWLGVNLTVSTFASLLVMPIMFMTMGSVVANPDPDPIAMMQWQLSTQLPLVLIQYAALIFIGVRFSPAAATSVARQRFSFFAAWTVTRGRFWALFGSWVILWLIFSVIYLIVSGIVLFAFFAQIAPLAAENFQDPSPENIQGILAAMFSPRMLLSAGISYAAFGVVAVCYALMSFGVNARAALAAMDEGKIEAAPV